MILNRTEDFSSLLYRIKDGKIPDVLPLLGLLPNVINGHIDYEAIVDEWPNFTSVVLRPKQQWQPKLLKSFYIFTTNPTKLKQLLTEESTVPWGTDVTFAACPVNTVDLIQQVAADYCIPVGRINPCHTFMFGFPENDDHRKLLPEGLTLDRVRAHDAALINYHWPYSRGAETQKMIQTISEVNPTACVRTSSGAAVSWGVISYDGQMGLGHTLVEYRRKKLNRIMMLELLWRCRQREIPMFGFVAEGNTASLTNMATMGPIVTRCDKMTWMHFSKKENKL